MGEQETELDVSVRMSYMPTASFALSGTLSLDEFPADSAGVLYERERSPEY